MHIIQLVSCGIIIVFHPKADLKAAPDENNEFTQGESNGSYLNENMQSCTRLAVLHEAQMLLAF